MVWLSLEEFYTKIQLTDARERYRIAGKFGKLTVYEHLAIETLVSYRSANWLLIASTNSDGFNLANHG